MNDFEIPESQWETFCASFTHQHHGWLVGMHQLATEKLLRGEIPAQAGVLLFPDYRPLQEVREGRVEEQVDVMVTVGEGTDETSFLIEDALALYNRKTGELHQGLRIDSCNGMTTLLDFRTAAAPESLDGLADTER